MKKKTVELSRWHVAAFIVLVSGIFLLMWGVVSWYRLRAALNISMLDIEDLRTGKYVKGEITRYAGKDVETVLGNKFHGTGGGLAYGFDWYDSYTIPALNEKYVTILIKDKDPIKDKLESYDKGNGSGAYFVGRVEKPIYDINYDFWENSSDYKTYWSELAGADEAKEKICGKYVIRQIYPDRIQYMMLAGISLIVTAFIGFHAKGGIRIKEEY